MRSEKPLYKKVWFWLISTLALYTFFGFIAIPFAIAHLAPQKVKESIGIDFGVENVSFNPFNFKITLYNPFVKDKHNKEVISFESLHVDLNPSNLVNKEVLLNALELNKPKIFIHIQKDGQINLNNLISQSQKEKSEQKSEPYDLIFSINSLKIREAQILLQDDTQETPFKLELKPLNYTAKDISTKRGNLAAHKFEATSTYAKNISWEGGLSLKPLKLYGKIIIKDAKLEALNNYSNLSISRGFASLDVPYTININDNNIALHVQDAQITLNDFLIMNDKVKLAHIGQFKLSKINVDTKINDKNININLLKTRLDTSHVILFENDKHMAKLDFFDIENISSKISLKNGKTSGDLTLFNIKAQNAIASNPANIPLHAELENILIGNISAKIASASNIKVSIPNLDINNLDITHLDDSSLGGFEKFGLKKISLDLENQNINIENTLLLGLYANAMLKSDGNLDIRTLFPKDEKNQNEIQNETSKPWNYTLKTIAIKDAKTAFSDLSLNEPITHRLDNISLHVKNFNSQFNTPFDYQLNLKDKNIFNLSSEGKITLKPLHVSSSLDIKHTQLEKYQPYLEPFTTLYLQSAKLFTKAKVDLTMPEGEPINVNTSANTKIQNLLLTNNNQPLFSWKELNVKGISYKHAPMSLNIKSINIDEPYAKVKINEDRSTNLDNIIKETNDKEAHKKEDKITKKPNIKIGPMKLKKGSADFADFSLPLKFSTKIHALEGSISKLNLNSTQPSKMNLKGLVDKYGYANIQGSLSPFALKKHANIDVTFKNIDLTNMTPYSGKFVGYAIKEGKLSLDLNYDIKDATLQGDNKINLDSLTLGKKIQSKDALNLPLDLAIALLKDSNGQIDINLPVTGNLDDPKFSYGSIVVKAITNLITGIVTAPFKMFGAILGIDGEKLKTIDFEPALATLLPSEMQKMQTYSKMLGKRPGIKLKIFGSYDKNVDGKVMKENIILKKIENKIKILDSSITEEKRYQRALEETFLTIFSQEDLNTTIQKYTTIEKVDANTTKEIKPPIIDYAKLNDDLREQLYKSIKITKDMFKDLSTKRALNISKELQKVGIGKNRILIEPIKDTKAKQDKWIACEVKIGS